MKPSHTLTEISEDVAKKYKNIKIKLMSDGTKKYYVKGTGINKNIVENTLLDPKKVTYQQETGNWAYKSRITRMGSKETELEIRIIVNHETKSIVTVETVFRSQ